MCDNELQMTAYTGFSHTSIRLHVDYTGPSPADVRPIRMDGTYADAVKEI